MFSGSKYKPELLTSFGVHGWQDYKVLCQKRGVNGMLGPLERRKKAQIPCGSMTQTQPGLGTPAQVWPQVNKDTDGLGSTWLPSVPLSPGHTVHFLHWVRYEFLAQTLVLTSHRFCVNHFCAEERSTWTVCVENSGHFGGDGVAVSGLESFSQSRATP